MYRAKLQTKPTCCIQMQMYTMNYRYIVVHMVQSELNITDNIQWTHVGFLLDRGNGKAFKSAGIRPSSGFGSIQVLFRKSDQNTFFTLSVSAYRELLIAAVFVVTIVRQRTSVLDKTACMCSKTSRVDNTKSVHKRPKPAVFVRTAQGLSSNQNEVAINSKSDLWRTSLLSACITH